MKVLLLVQLLLVCNYIKVNLACNGVGITVNYLRNCPGVNSIVKLNRANITLDDKCVLSSKGLREITRDYKTAQMTFSLEKSSGKPTVMRMDGCKSQSNPIVSKVFKLLAIPTSCPVKKGKETLKNTEDLNAMKQTLPFLAGRSSRITVNVVHDNGVSCLEGNYTIHKL